MTSKDDVRDGENQLNPGSDSMPSDEADSDAPKKPKKDFEIDIFRGWCKSCGICASFCPRDCIKLDEDGSPLVEESGRCTGCGWCELHCPDFAISVHPKKVRSIRQEEED